MCSRNSQKNGIAPASAKTMNSFLPMRSEIRPPATCPATPQRSIRVMIMLAVTRS